MWSEQVQLLDMIVGCLFTRGSDVAFTQNTKDRRLEVAGIRLASAEQQAEKARLSQDGSPLAAIQLVAKEAKVVAAQAQIDYLHSVVLVGELAPEKIAAKVAAAQKVLDRYGSSVDVGSNGRDQHGRFSVLGSGR
jgi:hypothetical protein